MKVIALDPGITTGYATGIITEGEPMGVLSGQAKWNEFELYRELEQSRAEIVIYEEFEYRAQRLYGKGQQHYKVELFSRNLIGVINMYVQQREHILKLHGDGRPIKCYTQKPVTGLGGYYKADSTLQAAGVYKVGKPHANDAMRHLLTWYTFGAGFQYDKDRLGFKSLA